jgi:hypothetical protein
VKLDDVDALQHVARSDADEQVRQDATARLTAFAVQGAALASRAAAALSDERSSSTVARTAALEAVALVALARLTERTALAGVARQADHEAVRVQALGRLNDPADFEAVATRSEHKDVGLAALDRLAGASTATLDGIALRARNKMVTRRAKAIVKERAAADAEARVAAEALARRRGQLSDAVDALARGRDRTRILSELEHLAQQWRDLPAPPADLAERWERSMERARMHYDELTRQETLEAEQRAAREAATAQRRGIIDAVAAVADEEPAERLAALRADWQALPPFDGSDAAALDREFTRAVDAIETRVANKAKLAGAQARLTELAADAAALADAPEQDAVRTRWQAVTHEWRDLTAGLTVDAALHAGYSAAVSRWKEREQAARDASSKQASENEAHLQDLLTRATALSANAEAPMKDLDRIVRDLRAAADKPGPLSAGGTETLLPKLKAVIAELTPRIHEARETDEWRRWANAGIQDELCKRIEALRELTDLSEAARQLRDLRRQWKAVAAAPRDDADTLWQRFKTAADETQARVDAHFATVAAEHAANLTRKLALCEQAETLAQSTDWIATAETLKKLQTEWQALGAVPKEQAAEIARRFRTACDTFFTRRKTDLAQRKDEWSENQKKKETLCVRMEELAESSDWNATFAEIKKLQADWKAVGPVRRNKSEALWKRFRGACDRFFERYGKRHEIDQTKRVEEREAVCRQLEALAPRFSSPDPEPVVAAAAAEAVEAVEPVAVVLEGADAAEGVEAVGAVEAADAEGATPDAVTAEAEAPAVAAAEAAPVAVETPLEQIGPAVHEIWNRWRQMPGLPPETFTPLRARFESALTTVLTSYPAQFKGTSFDLEGTRQRMQALCDEVEGVTRGNVPTEKLGGSSVTALAMLLKESLAANTIGGRVNEEAKARAALERVRRAQSSWRDLGPAIGSEAHTLESRFHRACRRFFEQHPQFEQSPRAANPRGPGGPGAGPGRGPGGGGGGHHRQGQGQDRPRGPRPSNPPSSR